MTKTAPRILIVDDVPDNVAVLFDFLRNHGFKLLASESGRQALEALPQMAPDLILLDVMMPELDGFETCRRIRADERFGDVPIFFMTALGDPVDKVTGLQAGAADYITKPIFPEEVLARIRVHLELRDRNRELAAQNEKLDAAVQRQLQAERALHEALDRPVLVVDLAGDLQFVAASAARLLQRYYPGQPTDRLPADVLAWLTQRTTGVFSAARGAHRLEFTTAPAGAATGSRLVYLDEKNPPPSPRQLLPLGLTPRECEVLFWVAQGKTSPEIGVIVGSAASTVKKHVENITAKLGVETRLAAALKAMELLGPPAA